jgi:hypothetical protein
MAVLCLDLSKINGHHMKVRSMLDMAAKRKIPAPNENGTMDAQHSHFIHWAALAWTSCLIIY